MKLFCLNDDSSGLELKIAVQHYTPKPMRNDLIHDYWCQLDIDINIDANGSKTKHSIKYHAEGLEALTSEELDELIEVLQDYLNFDIENDIYLVFIEPDLEFEIPAPINGVRYPVGLTINLWNDGVILGANNVRILMSEDQIKGLVEFLNSVVTE